MTHALPVLRPRRFRGVEHAAATAAPSVRFTACAAIGRGPALQGLGQAGVQLDAQGFIRTDQYQATNVPGIYAVGDVTGRAQLTPVAIAAGRRFADRAFGGQL